MTSRPARARAARRSMLLGMTLAGALVGTASGVGVAAASTQQPTLSPTSPTPPIAHRGAQGFDYNGDGVADIAVFRPAFGQWLIRGQGSVNYGMAGDLPLVGDFTGDGRSDPAVIRVPIDSVHYLWYVRGLGAYEYGVYGDQPVPADYNQDGTTDIAVYRPSNSTWYIRGQGSFVFGRPGDNALAEDYDGDGRADATVWRCCSPNNIWHIRGQGDRRWTTDGRLVPADYDGDNRAELATWSIRHGVWHIQGRAPIQWGVGFNPEIASDIPLTGDYDGDGRADLAVWRPSHGIWYIRGVETVQYGTSNDIPLSGAPR